MSADNLPSLLSDRLLFIRTYASVHISADDQNTMTDAAEMLVMLARELDHKQTIIDSLIGDLATKIVDGALLCGNCRKDEQ